MQRVPFASFSRLISRGSRFATTPAFRQSYLYSTMRAARYYGKEDIRVEQIPEPSIKPGQVKVSQSICTMVTGTDCPRLPLRLSASAELTSTNISEAQTSVPPRHTPSQARPSL